MTVDTFVQKWRASGASERSNYALFFAELCDVLGVPRPDPATDTPEADGYVIDRVVTLDTGATNYVDLYRRGCFVAEAKQGSDAPETTEREALGLAAPKRRRGTARRGTRAWETEMQKAKAQARRYARALPAADGWPPFLLVADIGFCFDLYADFSGQGKAYVPFPDQQSYRIRLEDLERDEVRERLRLVWADPLQLDPQRRAVAATRELAGQLARLARSLEDDGRDAGDVADFLMRALFTMFAEDVHLLPERSFTGLLEAYRGNVENAPKALASLWATMKTGGFAGVLGQDVRHFNGHLFADATAPPLSAAQLDLLLEASRADWAEVEPAIFGTLIEQALDPAERHRLGAHYTPRAYVERLVLPAVVEPLREAWEAAQAAAALREEAGDEAGARSEVEAFHRRLCSVRVLDPACGTGNFLYVTLEHLKRLEGEVTDALAQFPGQTVLDMTGGFTVSPSQLLGIELNPRAAAIAEVVLWIGYLQWHFRTFGSADRLDPPLLREYGNIVNRDAVLDEDGTPAVWPEADFIIGNPPFVGNKRMRDLLGDDYSEALRTAYPDVPESADLVMYWWDKAALAVRGGRAERFGFITTNSLTQTFNRRVVERHLAHAQKTAGPSENPAITTEIKRTAKSGGRDFPNPNAPLTLVFAVPDHPWVDSATGAAVRVAMTVGARADRFDAGAARLEVVATETKADGGASNVTLIETVGQINADLSSGADVTQAEPLRANAGLSNRGVTPVGTGFRVTEDEAQSLGLGRIAGLDRHIRPYRNGKDVTASPRGFYIIDLLGLDEDEVRRRFPEVYERLLRDVKPGRDVVRRASYRERWWVLGEPRSSFRPALDGLSRFIATPYVAKHRPFVFLDASVLPDEKLLAIASDDAFHLGVLSSRVHETWALAAGGRLGIGNDPSYNNSRTFEPFPFPAASEAQTETIRALGDAIDTHRKDRQELHPVLGLTDLYNAVEALRAGRALAEKEQAAADAGLARTLLDLHRRLDRAVLDAYGWDDLDAEAPAFPAAVLTRLVALNAERVAEEARGLVRYVRPSFQSAGTQTALDVGAATATVNKAVAKPSWPKSTSERVVAVRHAVARLDRPSEASEVAARFARARTAEVADVLDALDALGLVQRADDGRYSA